MSNRFQFARWMLGVTLCGALCWPSVAQKNHPVPPPRQQQKPDRPPQSASRQPAQNQARQNNANRPPINQSRPPIQQPYAGRPNPGTQPGGNNVPGRNYNPRQQLGVGAPKPWLQKMREIPPSQRERFFQNSRAFQNLPPGQQNKIRQQFNQWDHMNAQQRADQTDKENVWRSLSPEQKSHIKNDVLPTWRQMSPDRRQAIQQRLGVLRNMPEPARNQRLNDPRFTEGMSEEDRATLRDLSHMHIGGAPDPPGE